MRNPILKTLGLVALMWVAPAAAATPDGLITSNAKLALWTAPGVRINKVHVDTNDGVITLYGKVGSPAEKEIADHTVQDVVGVRAVKNLLQVVNPSEVESVTRTDAEIKDAAEKQLKADLSLKGSKIKVKSVDKGLVLLTGKAVSVSDHVKAVTDVHRVEGVQRVATEVKTPAEFNVDDGLNLSKPPEARSSLSDTRITAAVKLRLLTNSAVPTEISVDTDNGVVSLFGVVSSVEAKKAADAEASRVAGVRIVQNQLEVVVPTEQKQGVETSDAEIARDLALAFKERPEFKGVTTAVKNGTVRLTGTVASGWDELSAVRAARRVTGVRGVDDMLKVEQKTEPSPRG